METLRTYRHTCRECGKSLEINEVWVDNGGDFCGDCVKNSVPCVSCGIRVYVHPRMCKKCSEILTREKERDDP